MHILNYCREICHFHPEEMDKRAKQMALLPKEEKLPPGWVKRESRSIRGKWYLNGLMHVNLILMYVVYTYIYKHA